MSLTVGASGNKVMQAMTVGTSSGNKAVQAGFIGTASGNKEFYSATSLSAAASPLTVLGFSSGAGVATTTTATATPSNGVGPYTYSWSRASGDSSISIVAPSSSQTSFTGNVTFGESKTATFVCTVTDTSSGDTAVSNAVTANLQEIGGG